MQLANRKTANGFRVDCGYSPNIPMEEGGERDGKGLIHSTKKEKGGWLLLFENLKCLRP